MRDQSNYPQEVVANAAEVGYKAANLIFLSIKLSLLPSTDTSVPRLTPIESSTILSHLNKDPNFQAKWTEFQREMLKKDALTALAKTILQEIRNIVIESFKKTEFVLPNVESDLVMVRSTSNEDKIGSANQGGNESLPSNKAGLRSAIGDVIASYFSEKSIQQRLQSGERVTDNLPLMACLIQEMVGVAEEQGNRSRFVSGVIFTDDDNIRIQAAPGHGKLIVDSLGEFDDFYINKDDLVYADINQKKYRIAPYFNRDARKVILAAMENDFITKTSPSLDTDTIKKLAEVGRYIQTIYGMLMDIEFVYDRENNTINIVQARNRSIGTKFSALSNTFIAEKSPSALKGKVVTTDLMQALIIDDSKQLLICDTMEAALTQYSAHNSKDNPIKAIVIKAPAAHNSHGAGLFTQLDVPVLQINQSGHDVRDFIGNFAINKYVVDPQHSAIYQVKKKEVKEGLIEKGIFKSTIGTAVTPMGWQFAEPAPDDSISTARSLHIAKLAVNAKDDRDASRELFQALYSVLIPLNPEYNEKCFRNDLNSISLPTRDVEQQRVALQQLLSFIVKKRKSIDRNVMIDLMITGGELYDKLNDHARKPFDQTEMKDYLDLYNKFHGLILEQREHNSLSDSVVTSMARITADKKYLAIAEELGLSEEAAQPFKDVARFEAFIIKEDIKKKWLSFCKESCLASQEDIYKLSYICKTLAKYNMHEYWLNTDFTTNSATLDEIYLRFKKSEAKLEPVREAEKLLDILEHQTSQWTEPSRFGELHEELKDKLKIIEEKLESSKPRSKVNELLDKLELDKIKRNQEDQLYRMPFRTHAEMTQYIARQIKDITTAKAKIEDRRREQGYGDELVEYATFNQLNRLVDIFDNSLKSLQTSSLYEDKEIQAKNFHDLVIDFYKLMKSCSMFELSHKVPQSYNDDISSTIFSDVQYGIRWVDGEIDQMQSIGISAASLMISPNFSVIQSDIYQGFQRIKKFWTTFKSKGNSMTTADVHSFTHQTMISSLNFNFSRLNLDAISKLMPENTKDIIDWHNNSYSNPFILRDGFIKAEEVICDYNMPLNQHSLGLKLLYNYKRDVIKFNYIFNGSNDGGVRWGWLYAYSCYAFNKLSDNKALDISPSICGLHINKEFSLSTQKTEIKPFIDKVVFVIEKTNNLFTETVSLEKHFEGDDEFLQLYNILIGKADKKDIIAEVDRHKEVIAFIVDPTSIKTLRESMKDVDDIVRDQLLSNNKFLLCVKMKHLTLDEAIDLFKHEDKKLLHIAAAKGNQDLCELLIKYGSDPTAKNNEGKTPSEVAKSIANSLRETPDYTDDILQWTSIFRMDHEDDINLEDYNKTYEYLKAQETSKTSARSKASGIAAVKSKITWEEHVSLNPNTAGQER